MNLKAITIIGVLTIALGFGMIAYGLRVLSDAVHVEHACISSYAQSNRPADEIKALCK